jgi:hypothetical protein
MQVNSSNNIYSTIQSRLSEIKLFDHNTEHNLDLYCYTECSNDSDEFLKNCRGLVFEGDNLVLKGFPFTDEFHCGEKEKFEDTISGNFNEWKFFESHEGTLLRLFYHSGRWFLSTYKKLDAFKSKWSSKKSFGDLFIEALEHETKRSNYFNEKMGSGEDETLEKFKKCLDEKKQYMFLLKNTAENRIVSDTPTADEAHMFHVGTFENHNLVVDNSLMSKPVELIFETFEELLKYVDNDVNYKKTQGVLCSGPNGKQIKLLNSTYKNMSLVRGNTPSIKFRYFQIRQDPDMVATLKELYPNYTNYFNESEEKLNLVAKKIFKAYVDRFIKKLYVVVPPDEYRIVSECHGWHIVDRGQNKVTLDRVKQVLNRQQPFSLFKLAK